jgi:hypothetical protein
MIEFVLSRVWMVIAGLAMIAVVLAAFNGLDQGVRDGADIEGAKALVGVIEEMSTVHGPAELRVQVDELLMGKGTFLEVRPGSVWVHGPDHARAVTCPTAIVLIDGGDVTDKLVLRSGDLVAVRTDGSEVQLEKVFTTSLTASVNLAHSSSVL